MALGKLQGIAQSGGQKLTTYGSLTDETTVETYPLCTVTVYDAGTLNLSVLYSDGVSTPKANPFTASTDASWFFYAEAGSYDIQFSGTGIAVPFTLGDSVAISGNQISITNSAELAAALSDETGSGLAVFNTSPTLVNPVLGNAVGTSLKLSATAAPLIISPTGTLYSVYAGADESGPGLFLNRTIANEATANEHGVIDATQFGRANKAYAAFDSQPVFTGVNNYDHVSNFQARAVMASSGTLSNYYSFYSYPTNSAGSITNLYAFYASTGATIPGAVINRYSFVSEANAGNAGIGTTAPTHLLTVGTPETPVGMAARLGVFGTANCYGIFRDTTADIESVIGTDGTGTFIGSFTNHPVAIIINNTTKITLNTNGQLALGSSAPTVSAALDIQGTTGALLLPRLTTTQRDALTATNGMLVYNSSTDKAQVRAAGVWVDLH